MAYWAATQLEPRRERVAQYFLERAGLEVYLPRTRRHGAPRHCDNNHLNCRASGFVVCWARSAAWR
jgi:hypothetical protein